MSAFFPRILNLPLLLMSLYFGVLGVLCVYGLHRSWLLWRLKRRALKPHLVPRLSEAELPAVTVQLPVFNERFVVERLLEAVARLDYPRERLQIQVLDDSTDDTTLRVRQAVQRLEQAGLDIQLKHRTHREGFKAGALSEGLAQATGALIVIFDADFVPPSDFLRRLVPLFVDARVGMVQARWGHLNPDYSRLTGLQQLLLDAHFQIEHASRHASGHCFNFNGTAGIWRRECIVAAGGWQHDTLTEDLDLSYRAQLLGWKFLYVPEVVCPAELPVEMSAFKGQQRRWAKGGAQVGLKLLGRILRSELSWGARVDAWFHLTGSLSYLLMVVLTLLMPVTLWLRTRWSTPLIWIDGPLFLVSMGSLFHFYLYAQRELDSPLPLKMLQVLGVMAVGAGLAINNGLAVAEALLGRKTPFVRTAKHRIAGRIGQPEGYLEGPGPVVWVEILMALWFVAGILYAIWIEHWSAIPFLSIFACGFGYVGMSSILGRLLKAREKDPDVWSSIVRLK